MLRPRVLLVEDDEKTRHQLAWGLKDEFDLEMAADRATALSIARKEEPDVILLDLALPPCPTDPEEGFRFLQDLCRDGGSGKVLVYTGYSERHHAVRAISYGASDFLTKPIDLDALKFLLQRHCWVADLEKELASTPQNVKGEIEEMVGTSPAIRQVFAMIRKVATTEVPVLIVGESGTGKELTAKAIHERSPRKDGPFVTINCGAIPETLLEAELFGYEKGSFTGAVQARKGKLEYAHRGTLFLDEIGDLSLPLQVKLLRFIQDNTIERVGGRQTIEVDARIIAATNVNIEAEIKRGGFREDLYYRLGVVTMKLPPLRERAEDSVVMAVVFLKRVREQMGKRVQGFTKEARKAIEAHSWPGNVRELLNKVRRAVAMAEGPYLTPEDLDIPLNPTEAAPAVLSLKGARERLEADMLIRSMASHDCNLSRVAEDLRISRPTVYSLLRKYGIRDKGIASPA